MQKQRLDDIASESGMSLKKYKSLISKTENNMEENRNMKKQAKWKMDHEKFMAAIKAGKQISQAVKAGVPISQIPNIPVEDHHDDRVPCPHWYVFGRGERERDRRKEGMNDDVHVCFCVCVYQWSQIQHHSSRSSQYHMHVLYVYIYILYRREERCNVCFGMDALLLCVAYSSL